jgi:hypothetical protein
MVLVLAGVAGCGRGDRDSDVAVSDSLARDLEISPPESSAVAPLPQANATRAEKRESRVGARSATRPARPAATRQPRTPKAPARESARPAGRPPVVVPARPNTGSQAVRSDTTPAVARPDTSVAAADSGTDAPADTQAGAAPPAETPSAAAPPTDTKPAVTAAADTHPAAVASVDTQPAPSPSPAAAESGSTSVARTRALPVGTEIRALLEDSIHSLRNSEGQRVTARIADDLRASDGSVIVPAGAVVRLGIARLRPARTKSARDGELELRADSLVVAGRASPLSAEVRSVPHELHGRGVTAGEVEKVAAGAAVGAAAGGVITGKRKGAVIGGAVGAAGGAVVAAQTASRDVVVPPRTAIRMVLTAPWEAASRSRP